MRHIVIVPLLVVCTPVIAQDDFETWKDRCLNLESLWSEEEVSFCNGLNYALQNTTLSTSITCPQGSAEGSLGMVITGLGGDTSAITTNDGGNVFETAPGIDWMRSDNFGTSLEMDGLIVMPDAPATLSSPSFALPEGGVAGAFTQ